MDTRSFIRKLIFITFGLLLIVSETIKSESAMSPAAEALSHLSKMNSLRLRILFVRFSLSVTPYLSIESIDANADMVSQVEDPALASIILWQVLRSVDSCDGREEPPVEDVRLKIEIYGQDDELLGTLISDGGLVELAEVGVIGCATAKFRFLFGQGDPGYADIDRFEEEVAESLRKRSATSHQEIQSSESQPINNRY